MDQPQMPVNQPTQAPDSAPDTLVSSTPISPQLPQFAVQPAAPQRRLLNKAVVWVFVVVVLAAGGYGAYYFWHKHSTTATSASKATTTPNAAAMVTKVETLLPGTEPASQPYISYVKRVGSDNFYTGIAIASPADTIITGRQLTVASSVASSTMASLDTLFQTAGFSESTSTGFIYHQYLSANVVCQADDSLVSYTNATGDHKIIVKCADLSLYHTAASAQAPFAAVFTASSASKDVAGDYALYGLPVVKSSETLGYATTKLSVVGVQNGSTDGIDGASAMFYQTPDKTWHYFKSTQALLSCSEYNTPDLKKAFLGETCLNASGQDTTTVSL